MSRLLKRALLVLLLGAGLCMAYAAVTRPKGNGVAAHGALRVSGGQLLDAHGQVTVLRGTSSHGITWYPRYLNGAAMQTLAGYGANLQRLAMYTEPPGAYLEDREKSLNYLYMGIESALSADMYVIVDWHILEDGDPLEYVEEAKQFFAEVSARYSQSPAILYEICNEPNGDTDWEAVRAYAAQVIPVIRAHDPDAVILVGTPNYCTDFSGPLEQPLEYDNIMYVLHRYVDVSQNIPCDVYLISSIVEAGLPVFVSEWGTALWEQALFQQEEGLTMENAGAHQEAALPFLEYMQEHNISWAAWALSNKDEMHSILRADCDKYSGWLPEEFTDFGRMIVEHF